MTFVGMIFARGGSKGVPDKNLQIVAGVPLITRTIRVAQSVSGIDRVIVSTDSQRIAKAALSAGADVPFLRPRHLAKDTSAEWLSWQHALSHLRESEGFIPDALVSTPTTSPLRLARDVEACMSKFQEGQWDAVVTVTPARRNPYFNMVRLDGCGAATLALPSSSGFFRRQDAPLLYDMCTVAYVASSDFVSRAHSLWEGRIGTVVIPQERALDIDTPFDLQMARLLVDEET